MAVFVDGTNIIVRVDALERIYPGGLNGLERDCPNQTFCTDGYIARIGFMADLDASRFINYLVDQGLTHKMASQCIDLTIFSAIEGVEEGCDWLNVSHDQRGFDFAWHAGNLPGEIVAPEIVDMDNYKEPLTFYSPEDIAEHLEFIREDGAVRVFRDKRDGKILYSGRTTSLSNEAIEARVKELWDRTFQLEAEAGEARRTHDQEKGQAIYSELLDIAEESERLSDDKVPQSIYLAGLVRRVLEMWEDAQLWFSRFAANHPFHPDIWLELTWCLAMMGRMEESLEAARKAHEIAPDSPAALGNLAAALQGVGKTEEAKRYLNQALRIDPSDHKNQQMLAYLNSVDPA